MRLVVAGGLAAGVALLSAVDLTSNCLASGLFATAALLSAGFPSTLDSTFESTGLLSGVAVVLEDALLP